MSRDDYRPEELIELVAELAAGYTGYDHTSISYERAEYLMEAVMYCIDAGAWCTEDNKPMTAERPSAREAYMAGKQQIRSKMNELRQMYNEMIMDFKDYGMRCMYDTVVKGIPEFIKRYDVRFAPQENFLTLDYPVLCNLHSLSGVNLIYKYVKAICMEQRFLSRFSEEYIHAVLTAYYPEYEHLFENVCGLVLKDTIEHMLTAEDIERFCARTEDDRTDEGDVAYESDSAAMRDDKSEGTGSARTSELHSYIDSLICRIIVEYYGGDNELEEYLRCAGEDIAVRILTAPR